MEYFFRPCLLRSTMLRVSAALALLLASTGSTTLLAQGRHVPTVMIMTPSISGFAGGAASREYDEERVASSLEKHLKTLFPCISPYYVETVYQILRVKKELH